MSNIIIEGKDCEFFLDWYGEIFCVLMLVVIELKIEVFQVLVYKEVGQSDVMCECLFIELCIDLCFVVMNEVMCVDLVRLVVMLVIEQDIVCCWVDFDVVDFGCICLDSWWEVVFEVIVGYMCVLLEYVEEFKKCLFVFVELVKVFNDE